MLCCPVTQALLNANDFIALSAYGSGYPTDASQLTYRSAEIPLYTLAYELSFFGIDLKAYMDRPVLYVEQVRGTAAAGLFSVPTGLFSRCWSLMLPCIGMPGPLAASRLHCNFTCDEICVGCGPQSKAVAVG